MITGQIYPTVLLCKADFVVIKHVAGMVEVTFPICDEEKVLNFVQDFLIF